MEFNAALAMLRAAADPSRLRLLCVLRRGESSVSDLVAALGQSQPRVSRHLGVLEKAALVERFKEGRTVYYRLSADARTRELRKLLDGVTAESGRDSAGDRRRLQIVQSERERALLRPRSQLGAMASVDEQSLAAALDAALGDGPLGDVLDIGCGSGRVLALLAPRARSLVGVDRSAPMRQFARARLQAAGFSQVTLRAAAADQLPFAAASADVIVLDEVLASASAPAAVLAEAARVLRPDGQLIVVDRILPPQSPAFERQLKAAGFSVNRRSWLPGRAPDFAVFRAVPEIARRPNRARTGTHD